jgi:hypothetical protein
MGVEKLFADLSQLRRRIRALLITQAAAGLIGIVCGVCLLAGVLDYLFHFPAYVRLIWVGFLVTWCGRYIYRRIYLPVAVKIPLDQLALALPSVSAEVRDSIASSLAYAQHGSTGSDQLWQRVMSDASGAIHGPLLASKLSRQGAARAMGYAVVAIMAIFLVRQAFSELFGVGVRRVTTPWSDVRWPRKVDMEALSGDGVVARGESFKAQMRLARGGSADLRTYINFHFEDGRIQRELLRRDTDGVYRRTIEKLQEDIRYSFTAGDDDTSSRPFRVHVAERPEVVSARIRVTPPEYASKVPSRESLLDETPVPVLDNSRVELGFVFNTVKERNASISAAALQFDDSRRIELTEMGGVWSGALVAEVGDNKESPPDELESSSIRILRFGVDARDVTGLRSRDERRFAIEVRRDQPPKVRIIHPESMVELTPRAFLEVEVSAEDDLEVKALRLLAATRREGAMRQVADLIDTAKRGKSPGKLEVRYRWDLAEMRLSPGDVVEYAVEAEDGLTVRGKPRPAVRTPAMRIAIISADAFANRTREDLVSMRRGLQRLLAELESLHEMAKSLDEGPAMGKAMNAAERERVEQLLSRNRAAINRMTDAGRRLGELVRQSEMNRLATSESSRQALQLQQELKNIAEQPLSGAGDELSRAAQSASADEQHEHLKSAAEEQGEAAAALRELLESTDQWNQFEDLVRRTRELLDRQEGLVRDVTELARSQGAEPESKIAKGVTSQLRQSQKQLGTDTTKLAMAMKRMSEQLLESDRTASDSLAHASEMCYQQNISGRMEEAADELRLGRFNLALTAQSSAAAGLRAMLMFLEEKPQRELAELTRQLQDQIKKLEKIVAAQKDLIQRTKDGVADASKTSWKVIATRQETLGRTSTSFGEALKATSADGKQAKAEIANAALKMSDAGRDLRVRSTDAARENQDEALAGLERALALLKKWERKTDQTLAEKSLAAIIEAFVEIHRKEREIRDETAVVVERSTEKRGRSRAEGMKLQRLASRQKDLTKPLADLKEKVRESAVFAYVCVQISGKMEKAGEFLAQREGADALRVEDEILSQLVQLISSLDEPPGPQKQNQFVDSEQQGAAAQPTAAKPVPTVAELKVLRLMQADVHKQTVELNHAEGIKDGQQTERLTSLGRSQSEIHEMAVKMLEKAQEGGK